MKLKLNQIIPSFVMTILILVVLEILVTTIMPILGIENYKLPFNILIILYIGFKLETPIVALLVLGIQICYSFFSIEGWALGTFAGVIVCMIISYLRDMLHFNSKFFTIVVTQIFQICWFIIVSILIYLKVENFDYILGKLGRFLPESLIISIMAPFFFSLLDRIWKINDREMLGEEV
ncbi:MAG: hypothetical protein KAQ98_03930 [Bacteriovoracaceae bacterium]|nr:hypothetical protein [Bacteriovoracaceae bacterium]